jgi:hypothetical protein
LTSPESSQESEYRPETDSTGQDEHAERTKHEIVTVQMLTEFLSVIVDMLQRKRPGASPRLVVTASPTVYKVANKFLNCYCLDNGSLVWQQKVEGSGQWKPAQTKTMCVIEAKPRVTNWNSDGQPAVTADLLGQQFCEILGAFLSKVNLEDGIREWRSPQ